MYHHRSPLRVTSKKQDCQEYFQAPEIFCFLIGSVFILICLHPFCHFTLEQHDVESFTSRQFFYVDFVISLELGKQHRRLVKSEPRKFITSNSSCQVPYCHEAKNLRPAEDTGDHENVTPKVINTNVFTIFSSHKLDFLKPFSSLFAPENVPFQRLMALLSISKLNLFCLSNFSKHLSIFVICSSKHLPLQRCSIFFISNSSVICGATCRLRSRAVHLTRTFPLVSGADLSANADERVAGANSRSRPLLPLVQT